jgi:NAD(P)-dependent dehydrogenase (short-subunit alcohol dehydrogenase family)
VTRRNVLVMNTAVITGASRGIGKATAAEFFHHGWSVIGTSTSGRGWSHDHLSWIALDLAESRSIATAADAITSRGAFDVLINNAGTMPRGGAENSGDIAVSALREVLEVNLIGTIDFTERVLPAIKSGGHIVLLGSGLGALNGVSGPWWPSYSISKAALSMYTQRLAHRLKGRKITVSIVSPGWVKTDMGGKDAPRNVAEPAREIFDLATSAVPTGRFWESGKQIAW